MMDKYKHTPGALEKIKKRFESRHSVTVYCALIAVYFIALVIYSFIKGDVWGIITCLALGAVAIAFLSIAIYKLRERLAIGNELKTANDEEGEFFKINCTYVSLMRIPVRRFSLKSGKVEGYRIFTNDGKQYIYFLENLAAVPIAEEIAFENKELTGTLYVRKYKGTNLLCEIKKSI